jgi:hypothetical protein
VKGWLGGEGAEEIHATWTTLFHRTPLRLCKRFATAKALGVDKERKKGVRNEGYIYIYTYHSDTSRRDINAFANTQKHNESTRYCFFESHAFHSHDTVFLCFLKPVHTSLDHAMLADFLFHLGPQKLIADSRHFFDAWDCCRTFSYSKLSRSSSSHRHHSHATRFSEAQDGGEHRQCFILILEILPMNSVILFERIMVVGN